VQAYVVSAETAVIRHFIFSLILSEQSTEWIRSSQGSENHTVSQLLGRSAVRPICFSSCNDIRPSVGEMSRNEETSSARRADGRRDAGPGRAGQAGPLTLAGRNLAVYPVSRLTTGRAAAIRHDAGKRLNRTGEGRQRARWPGRGVSRDCELQSSTTASER